MRPIISEEMVELALSRLKENGAKQTLDSIRTELGNHGSKTTIVKHLRALKAKNTDDSRTQPQNTCRVNISDDRVKSLSNLSNRSNDFVRLLETLNKFGTCTCNPQIIEEVTAIFAELTEENLKYQHLLNTLHVLTATNRIVE